MIKWKTVIKASYPSRRRSQRWWCRGRSYPSWARRWSAPSRAGRWRRSGPSRERAARWSAASPRRARPAPRRAVNCAPRPWWGSSGPATYRYAPARARVRTIAGRLSATRPKINGGARASLRLPRAHLYIYIYIYIYICALGTCGARGRYTWSWWKCSLARSLLLLYTHWLCAVLFWIFFCAGPSTECIPIVPFISGNSVISLHHRARTWCRIFENVSAIFWKS